MYNGLEKYGAHRVCMRGLPIFLCTTRINQRFLMCSKLSASCLVFSTSKRYSTDGISTESIKIDKKSSADLLKVYSEMVTDHVERGHAVTSKFLLFIKNLLVINYQKGIYDQLLMIGAAKSIAHNSSEPALSSSIIRLLAFLGFEDKSFWNSVVPSIVSSEIFRYASISTKINVLESYTHIKKGSHSLFTFLEGEILESMSNNYEPPAASSQLNLSTLDALHEFLDTLD